MEPTPTFNNTTLKTPPIIPTMTQTTEHLKDRMPNIKRVVTIKAGHQHAIYCPVTKVPLTIRYSFHTEEHSINFGILKTNNSVQNSPNPNIVIHRNCSKESILEEEEEEEGKGKGKGKDNDDETPLTPPTNFSSQTTTILSMKKYSSIDLPNGMIENSITITEKGTFIFVWCNSFSYKNEKHVSLSLQYSAATTTTVTTPSSPITLITPQPPTTNPSKGSIFWKRKESFPLRRWSKKFFLLQRDTLKWWNNIFDYEMGAEPRSSFDICSCSSLTQIPGKWLIILEFSKSPTSATTKKIIQIRSLTQEQFDTWRAALRLLIENKEDHSLMLSGYQDRITESISTNRLLLSRLREEVREGDDGGAGRFLRPMEQAFHSLDDLFHCLDDYARSLSLSPASSTASLNSLSLLASPASSAMSSMPSSTTSSLIDPNEVFEDEVVVSSNSNGNGAGNGNGNGISGASGEDAFYDTEEYIEVEDDEKAANSTEIQEFRRDLPHVPSECKVSLGQIFFQNLGKPMSMPVALNEPITILQKMAEDFEWGGTLLPRIADSAPAAAVTTGTGNVVDPVIYKMSLVAAFAISSYSSSQWRMSRKPFTCMLGETYELKRSLVDSTYRSLEGEGFTFLAEKISHKPLAVAAFARSDRRKDGWQWWTYQVMKNSHKGSTMDLRPEGLVNLRTVVGDDDRPSSSSSSHYQWNKVITSAKNVFSTTGKRLEHSGLMEINLLDSSYSCKINFKPNKNAKDPSLCNQIEGRLLFKGRETGYNLVGYWDLYVDLVDSQMVKIERLWTIEHLVDDATMIDIRKWYGFTPWTLSLNDPLHGYSKPLPPSDSRFRTDQRAVEQGDHVLAGSEKLRLEALQRQQLKHFKPRWFCKASDGVTYEIRDNEEYWCSLRNNGK